MPGSTADDAALAALFETCSNTGRWGADDEAGTLNLITDAVHRAAAATITAGETVALGRTLVPGDGVVAAHPVTRHLLYTGPDPISAVDVITITPHDPAITHIDALGHVFWEGRAYNGRRRDDILGRAGLGFGTTAGQREGIFTRGVLLDVAALHGVPFLAADAFVTADDLDGCLRRQGVEIREGDAVVLHTGRERRERAQPDASPLVRSGLDGSAVHWLHRSGVAVFGGDGTERMPYPSTRMPSPLHQIGIASMGLCLVDGMLVEPLVAAADRHARTVFAFTFAPVHVTGATGFPVNPLAVF